MDKKELKFYEAPAVELVETELEGFLCVSDLDDEDLGEGESGGSGGGDFPGFGG